MIPAGPAASRSATVRRLPRDRLARTRVHAPPARSMTSPVASAAPLPRAAFEQPIDDIAQALAPLLRAGDLHSLGTLPGATLFFTHLARASGDAGHLRAAREAAELSAEAIARVPMQPHLHGGVAGMAWPLAHMQRLGVGDAAALDFDGVDEMLVECVRDGLLPHYDLIVGTVGVGVYFLERLPAPAAVEGLRLAIRSLEAAGERDERGLRWFTGPEMVSPSQRERLPEGKYDLGMAHGVAGVIAFLALALMDGAARQPAEEMLREAVRWLASHQRADALHGAYGTGIDVREPDTPLYRRAAWCYGDPGVAVALLLASRALGDGALERRAHRLARTAAAFAESERARVVDPSLCHGSEGLAHMFSILGAAFGDETLRACSGAWHATTLRMRSPGEGVAGFCYSQWDEGAGERRKTADPSFLQGAAGVGLSLVHAAGADGDRSWDRLLLLG